MTHPKGLRLANETYAREPLMQAISEGCEMQALMDEVAALKAKNEWLRQELSITSKALGYFLRRSSAHEWAYTRNRAEELALDALKGGAA